MTSLLDLQGLPLDPARRSPVQASTISILNCDLPLTLLRLND